MEFYINVNYSYVYFGELGLIWGTWCICPLEGALCHLRMAGEWDLGDKKRSGTPEALPNFFLGVDLDIFLLFFQFFPKKFN